MLTVNKRDVDLIDGKLIGDASTMGLGVGEWPDFIAIVDDAHEGFLFLKGSADIADGEIIGYYYYSKQGLELQVVND